MSAISKPQLLVFRNGKLVTQESEVQTEASPHAKTVVYRHTIKATPDEYHTETIKQYRRQLNELRKNYYELQRVYWALLGYRVDGPEPAYLPITSKQIENMCVTEVSSCSGAPSLNLQGSEVNIHESIAEIAQNHRKLGDLSESILEFQSSFKSRRLPDDHKMFQSVRNTKTKTENDEEEFEQNLGFAFSQIQELKQALNQAHINSEAEMREMRESYEEHIRKLQQILDRERRHNKMLNGVISRNRLQIENKENLVKSIMGLKSTDKGAIEKLMKHLKINI